MTKKKSEPIVDFSERERRWKAVQKRVQEAYPMAGTTSGEDALWRSLSTDAARDLNQMTQKRMQEIAFYLYDTNPMAKRIIDIIPDFVIGDGFTYTTEDEEVFKVIDSFWNDPDNQMDLSIYDNAMEISLFGENCFPFWVNPANGAVKLGYVDPSTIIKVTKMKDNPRLNDKVIWKSAKARKERELQIVNINRKTGMLEGDCFYFAINKPIAATRGRSDLLALSDWLDGHDQFLFARLERAFLINTFIWDIECEGMNKEELETFVQSLPTPKPGSTRAHNEKVKWNVLSPKLEAQDASQEARLFKNQILGGAGYPEHWFAEGCKTTRATALEMGLPTLKKLKRRQKIIKYQYKKIIDFVIDQAVVAGTLSKGVNRNYEILPSPIVSRDNKGLAEAMRGFVDGLAVAVTNKWVTNAEAKASFRTMIGQVGVESTTSHGPDDEEEPEEVVGKIEDVNPEKKKKPAEEEGNSDEK